MEHSSHGTEYEWPPKFSLDQEAILNLLTGDRFYSDPSAALREAVLNAIDAIRRRQAEEAGLAPLIEVVFDKNARSLSVSDNGIGMSRDDVSQLFAKVGASAAGKNGTASSVGEFGIGVVSYFMAGNLFTVETHNGTHAPICLTFRREMLAGSSAEESPATRSLRGTTVTIAVRDEATFDLLVRKFSHWCRGVEGLTAVIQPTGELLAQRGIARRQEPVTVPMPDWVERAHLAPVSEPTGWDALTGVSTISVLYRGVFVQEFEVRGLWGIEGSIDVNPKHFKPRLNREGFVAGKFQQEVEAVLRSVHPAILERMATYLASAAADGQLDKWTEKRWASLWLSVPRSPHYAAAVAAWDQIFRSLPAFELASGTKWEPLAIQDLLRSSSPIYVAPLAEEHPSDIVKAAIRLLRSSGHVVIRGIKRDPTWNRYAAASFGTTADLITRVFRDELPPLLHISSEAEEILRGVNRIAPLFTGPPAIDIVRLGEETPPALRLANRLVINADNMAGAAMIEEVLRSNSGPENLVGVATRHAYEQLTQVAAAVRDIKGPSEILTPIRRRYIRSRLS